MRPVMFDIDGVLADFVYGFLKVVSETAGGERVTPYTTHQQKMWDFDLPPALLAAAWDRAKLMRHFWADLPALVDVETFKAINRMHRYRDVYFVTSRVGQSAHAQTREWLLAHGIYQPTVIVSRYKGQFARAVEAAAMIDDKAGNAVYVAYESPGTASFILDRKYNQFDHSALGSKVLRVAKVEDFIKAVEAIA